EEVARDRVGEEPLEPLLDRSIATGPLQRDVELPYAAVEETLGRVELLSRRRSRRSLLPLRRVELDHGIDQEPQPAPLTPDVESGEKLEGSRVEPAAATDREWVVGTHPAVDDDAHGGRLVRLRREEPRTADRIREPLLDGLEPPAHVGHVGGRPRVRRAARERSRRDRI